LSLREEIENILLEMYPFGTEILHHTGEDEEYASEATTDILKLIEKRIDELDNTIGKKFQWDGGYEEAVKYFREMLK
jgi:hypothetical protein